MIAHGFALVGHHLNGTVIMETDEIIVFQIGYFQSPQPVLFCPGLNERHAFGLTSSG